jgi:hypothetical protein
MTTPLDIENLTLSLSILKITTMPLEIIKPKTITGLDTLNFDKKTYVRLSESAIDAFLYGGICMRIRARRRPETRGWTVGPSHLEEERQPHSGRQKFIYASGARVRAEGRILASERIDAEK